MNGAVQISINGRPVSVPAGVVVAAALARSGTSQFRSSVSGEPRGPLCGMGICMECRVTINGQTNCRSCLVVCEEGMEIHTHG